ncbi:MAG: tetratricopeptide repeat protein [Bacteroidota bacterium]
MAKSQTKKNKTVKKTEPVWWNRITGAPYVYFLFFVAAFVIYGQVLGFYIGKFDEDLLISGNLGILKDFANLKMAFTRDAFLSFMGVGFYRPLQTVTFMIDAHFFHDRGSIFYLTNMLLHAATCSALFWLLTLLGNSRKSSFVFTLLYLTTPLFVHAIAWAPSRGDLLIGLTGILSVSFFISMVNTGRYKYGAFTLLAFLAAMFSKETAVLIPLLMAIWYFLAGKKGKLPIPALVMLIVGFLLIYAAYFFLRAQVVKIPTSAAEFGIGPFFHNIRTLPEYMAKFLIPLYLSPMSGFTVTNTLLGLTLFAILAFLAFRFSRGVNKMQLFGISWFLLFATPGVMYSHLLGGAAYEYLEHRAYLPMAGIIIVVVFLFNSLPAGKIQNLSLASALLMSLVLGTYSFIYAGNYENPMVFYDYTIKSNPASAMALSNRGLIRADFKDYQGAVADYEKAISIKPDYSKAYVNKGVSLAAQNDNAGAIEQYDLAIKFEPDLFQAHFNKANSETGLKQYDDAVLEYTRAIRIMPQYVPAYTARASAYYSQKNLAAADTDFTTAIRLDPKNGMALLNRGKVRYNGTDKAAACADWRAAAELGNSEARDLLGNYCK